MRKRPRSSEISTAKIAWKAKTDPDDVVVLELWDVVDKARKKPVEIDGQLSLAHRTRGVGKDGQPIREADGKVQKPGSLRRFRVGSALAISLPPSVPSRRSGHRLDSSSRYLAISRRLSMLSCLRF